jgi:hypothetical protein
MKLTRVYHIRADRRIRAAIKITVKIMNCSPYNYPNRIEIMRQILTAVHLSSTVITIRHYQLKISNMNPRDNRTIKLITNIKHPLKTISEKISLIMINNLNTIITMTINKISNTPHLIISSTL